MNWIQHLSFLYNRILASGARDLIPVDHTMQNAHICVKLDKKGNFLGASVLPPKTPLVIPVTEASEARSNNEAPHPLADKIQYVAGDYEDFGGTKKPYFKSYLHQLLSWSDSEYSHPLLKAVAVYAAKGSLVKDLVEADIFHTEKDGTVSAQVEDTDSYPIYASLPKTKEGVEFGSALICWTVDGIDTWSSQEIWDAWSRYRNSLNRRKDLCMATGEIAPIASLHPAKLRHGGDKAKLISSNDGLGFTFRGRLLNAEEALSVSAEASAKAHNALRWLIARQGIRNGDHVTVFWADNLKVPPNPYQDNFVSLSVEETEALSQQEDFGMEAANQIRLKMMGYKKFFSADKPVRMLILDSATPGRMAITAYAEILPDDFFSGMAKWQEDAAIPQQFTRSKEEGSKEKIRLWANVAPSAFSLFSTVYADMKGKASEGVRKQFFNRLEGIIFQGRPVPYEWVAKAMRVAVRPLNYEYWENERHLAACCGLYRAYRNRLNNEERMFLPMNLDPENRSRDYLFGRLLATAQSLEYYALYLQSNKSLPSRPTNAERLMTQFSSQPAKTWLTLEMKLNPYRMYLSKRGKTLYQEEISRLVSLFKPEDFTDNRVLSAEFLLGYHHQRLENMRRVKALKDQALNRAGQPKQFDPQ